MTGSVEPGPPAPDGGGLSSSLMVGLTPANENVETPTQRRATTNSRRDISGLPRRESGRFALSIRIPKKRSLGLVWSARRKALEPSNPQALTPRSLAGLHPAKRDR